MASRVTGVVSEQGEGWADTRANGCVVLFAGCCKFQLERGL